MAVIDVFTFNGEYELLDIHLHCLKDHVDEFIIVEAPLTFSGKQKPLYFLSVQEKYRMFPIKYYVVDENDPELWLMAEQSPNTRGAEHWKREFVQKESIKKALTHLNDDDICYIGDVDEIWEPGIAEWKHIPFKYKLWVYTYWLNNLSSEEFWGTLVSPYKHIRLSCLNHLRTNAWRTAFYAGWHFTSMGGYEEVRRKLTDSYTEESYATKAVMANLENALENGEDFLGRGFTYETNEEEWPQYLKENREKYKKLCR